MAEQKFLDESGLLRFWNTKVKSLIFKKATLQQDLVVKNPRVTVDLPDGYTFQKGSTMEDLFRYLYRHVYEEVNPNLSFVLPTVTVKVTNTSSCEVGDSVTYTVQKDSFSAGQIGTCEEPWEETPHQTRVASGSTEITNLFKIYSGSTDSPEECTDEPTMSSGKVTGTLLAENEGVNRLGIYFCGTTQYNMSTAKSYTSYHNEVNISGVSSFIAGTTVKSACKTTSVTGYYPSFGNVLFSATETSPSTINNLGNKINKAGSTEFYYGPTDTTSGNNTSFEIYFPATLSAVVKYWNTITNKWEEVQTTTTAKHFATMPAKNDTSRYPNGSLASGKEYKLIRQADGGAFGARKYQITLS